MGINQINYKIAPPIINKILSVSGELRIKTLKGVLNAIFDFKIYTNMTCVQTSRVQIEIAFFYIKKP